MALVDKTLTLECESCGYKNKLLGIAESSQQLDPPVHIGTLNRYVNKGLIPSVFVERGHFFRLIDLMNFKPPKGRWGGRSNLPSNDH